MRNKKVTGSIVPRASSIGPSNQPLREEFSRKLYTALQKKGWSQMDLSRHSGVPRDSISHYIAGRNMPGPANLKRITDALQVAIEQLSPRGGGPGDVTAIVSDLEVKMVGDKAWISVNKMVDVKTAYTIMELVKEYETNH